jgi:uncharacterized protein
MDRIDSVDPQGSRDQTSASDEQPSAAVTPDAARGSSYTIFVPLEDRPDETLLVHGYSGAYDRVSTEVADFLRGKESTDGATVPAPTTETIARLKRRGYLTERTPDQESALVARLAARIHAKRINPSYVFMPTYQCNLRCAYCFQDHMRTKPEFGHLLRTMTPALVDRLFLGIGHLDERHGVERDRDGRSITFFGGEPFLAESLDIVTYIIEQGRRRGFTRFNGVTNATELSAYAHLLGEHGISEVQITLDGPPEEHDRRRIRADGSGSFAAIAANVDMALAKGVRVVTRINVDRNNVALVARLAQTAKELGWAANPLFTLYAAPIAASNDKTDATQTMDSAELRSWIVENRAVEPGLALVSPPGESLEDRLRKVMTGGQDPMTLYKSSFCGAHEGMYVFDAFGDIYTCWERTGDPDVRLGYVAEDGRAVMREDEARAPVSASVRLRVLRSEPNDITTWHSRTIAASGPCSKCRYALYCGGGCAVRAIDEKEEFFTNYCDGFQANFRRIVATVYEALTPTST